MPDDDTEALESYDGQRDDYGRPDGQGVGTFQQTCVTYSGMWEMGRPAGPGQFTFPGGRHIQLKVERPTAADFCSRSSTLAPGYIWPQEPHENQQGREIDIDGFTKHKYFIFRYSCFCKTVDMKRCRHPHFI